MNLWGETLGYIYYTFNGVPKFIMQPSRVITAIFVIKYHKVRCVSFSKSFSSVMMTVREHTLLRLSGLMITYDLIVKYSELNLKAELQLRKERKY